MFSDNTHFGLLNIQSAFLNGVSTSMTSPAESNPIVLTGATGFNGFPCESQIPNITFFGLYG